MTVSITSAEHLARFLVRNGMSEPEICTKIQAQFPDANAELVLRSVLTEDRTRNIERESVEPQGQ